MIVERQIASQPGLSFAGRGIVVQVDLFPFDRPPQSFGENIVERTATAVHADRHRMGLEQLDVPRACELATLITVEDLRLHLAEDERQQRDDMVGRQTVDQPPGHHVAREPVQHGDQIQPATAQSDVCEINGLITNDKICMIRTGLLRLRRRPG